MDQDPNSFFYLTLQTLKSYTVVTITKSKVKVGWQDVTPINGRRSVDSLQQRPIVDKLVEFLTGGGGGGQ